MSRSVVQTLALHADGGKVLVLDTRQVPADTPLFKVVAWGTPLPKGNKPGPEHVYKIRAVGDKTVYKVTCNADGKFKHIWDDAKNGPKPTKKKTTTKRVVGDSDSPAGAAPAETKKAKSVASPSDAALMAKLKADASKALASTKKLEAGMEELKSLIVAGRQFQ